MTELLAKRNLLLEARYAYNFDRQIYINREKKKIFSLEFVEDKETEELRKRIEEDLNGEGWHFYFNAPPSMAVQKQLLETLG
jgi:hypothetical protein